MWRWHQITTTWIHMQNWSCPHVCACRNLFKQTGREALVQHSQRDVLMAGLWLGIYSQENWSNCQILLSLSCFSGCWCLLHMAVPVLVTRVVTSHICILINLVIYWLSLVILARIILIGRKLTLLTCMPLLTSWTLDAHFIMDQQARLFDVSSQLGANAWAFWQILNRAESHQVLYKYPIGNISQSHRPLW